MSKLKGLAVFFFFPRKNQIPFLKKKGNYVREKKSSRKKAQKPAKSVHEKKNKNRQKYVKNWKCYIYTVAGKRIYSILLYITDACC